MPSVPTRAGDVSYVVQGKGQPVIMLHATLHDCHDFDAIAGKLAVHYQTIAVDWPWHGDSKGPSAGNSPTAHQPSAVQFAGVLEDFVAALDLPPAVIIGNSVGGFAAARLAISHPSRVRALVLVNSGGFPVLNLVARFSCYLLGSPTVSRFIMPHMVSGYMSPQTVADESICRKVVARARTKEGAWVCASIWRSFLDPEHYLHPYDLHPRAKEIKAPTLLVWGTRDIVVPLKVGETTQKLISGSKLEVFDAGHVVFSSKPEEFLRVVEPFIQSTLERQDE
jgi:pimeloyl-ACP methyl ester carboxylesterase